MGETFALIYHENMDARTLSAPLLNYLLSDLKNTLLKVRFQVKPPETEEGHALLSQLDQSLAEPLRFPQLERNALLLCDLFTSSAEPSDPIPEVERYLQDNFADPSLCLSKLSEMYNISESYLSHMFKDRTGQNFSAYLESLRMNEAARPSAKQGLQPDDALYGFGLHQPHLLPPRLQEALWHDAQRDAAAGVIRLYRHAFLRNPVIRSKGKTLDKRRESYYNRRQRGRKRGGTDECRSALRPAGGATRCLWRTWCAGRSFPRGGELRAVPGGD